MFNTEHHNDDNLKKPGSTETCSNYIVDLKQSKPNETTQHHLKPSEAT